MKTDENGVRKGTAPELNSGMPPSSNYLCPIPRSSSASQENKHEVNSGIASRSATRSRPDVPRRRFDTGAAESPNYRRPLPPQPQKKHTTPNVLFQEDNSSNPTNPVSPPKTSPSLSSNSSIFSTATTKKCSPTKEIGRVVVSPTLQRKIEQEVAHHRPDQIFVSTVEGNSDHSQIRSPPQSPRGLKVSRVRKPPKTNSGTLALHHGTQVGLAPRSNAQPSSNPRSPPISPRLAKAAQSTSNPRSAISPCRSHPPISPQSPPISLRTTSPQKANPVIAVISPPNSPRIGLQEDRPIVTHDNPPSRPLPPPKTLRRPAPASSPPPVHDSLVSPTPRRQKVTKMSPEKGDLKRGQMSISSAREIEVLNLMTVDLIRRYKTLGAAGQDSTAWASQETCMRKMRSESDDRTNKTVASPPPRRPPRDRSSQQVQALDLEFTLSKRRPAPQVTFPSPSKRSADALMLASPSSATPKKRLRNNTLNNVPDFSTLRPAKSKGKRKGPFEIFNNKKGFQKDVVAGKLDFTTPENINSMLEWVHDSSAQADLRETAASILCSLAFPEETVPDLRFRLVSVGTAPYLFKLARARLVLVHKAVEKDEIVFGEQIAKGGAGIVYHATWAKRQVAVKVSSPLSLCFDPKEFWGEVAIMNLISHPNILKCLGAGIYRDELFCLMPLHSCSLQSLLNNSEITLSESQQIRMCAQITEATATLHAYGFLHRDLKTANVLVREYDSQSADSVGRYSATVADFGTARAQKRATLTKRFTRDIGTAAYAAPEVFSGEGDDTYTSAVDSYSCAMVMWSIFTRKVPFQGEGDIISLVLSGKRPSLDEVPSAVRELMVLGWDADAKKRPTCDEMSIFLKRLESISLQVT